MELVSSSLYTALRDDSEASVGIRALLGNTTSTPYNVYHMSLPRAFDFSPAAGNVGAITYHFVSSVPDTDIHGEDSRYSEDIYQFTAYHRKLSTVEDVHRRIRWRLQNGRSVSAPASQAIILNVKLDSESAPVFDDVFKIWYQPKFYRVWVRDDDLH